MLPYFNNTSSLVLNNNLKHAIKAESISFQVKQFIVSIYQKIQFSKLRTYNFIYSLIINTSNSKCDCDFIISFAQNLFEVYLFDHTVRRPISRPHLSGTHSSGAHLSGAHLSGAHLSGTHLSWWPFVLLAVFPGAYLSEAHLSENPIKLGKLAGREQ